LTPRDGWWAGLLLALAISGLAFAFLVHPVCVRLLPAEVESFRRWQPIEERTDRQWHGPVFQRRGGQWYQCKSWISRRFFF
jgi:hypothetical protein